MINYLFYSEDYCKFCLEEKSNSYICDNCIERLEFIDGSKILENGNCYYPLFYNNYIKNIIKKYKYEDSTYLVKPLAEILYKFYLSKGLDYEYISFVPMINKDEFVRGYNQSYLLAKELSEYLDIELIDLVEKIRVTKDQNKIDRFERKKNLENSFRVYKNLDIDNKKILIIDDLVTTGATFDTIAKEIKSVYDVEISLLAISSSKIDTDYQ